MQESLKNFLDTHKDEADFIGIRHSRENSNVLFFRDEKLSQSAIQDDQGIMIEVMHNGHMAYAASPSLEKDALKQTFQKAKEWAKRSSEFKIHGFTPAQVRPPFKEKVLAPESNHSISTPQVVELLLEGTRKLKVNSHIISAQVIYVQTKSHMSYFSTLGSEIEQTANLFNIDYSATAAKDGDVQRRSSHFICRQQNLEDFDQQFFLNDCIRVGEEAYELLNSENCPAENMDLILAPDQLYLQIHESIGHPLELDRILGDERNYAGWSFLSPEDFGSLQYGSKILNVTFDPTLKGEYASYAFDDSGNKATKEYLIKEGKLLRGIGGLESQKRSDIPGVSSFRASGWNRAPIDRMANINIEPGTSSLNDMISNVERGLYMQTNRSWSIDDYRNKFQFGCEYAKLIENGKITKTIKNPNYRGVTTSFWNNLKMVGDQSTYELWGSPYCGKGEPNQMVRVGHACPTSLFSNIEVFGGEA